MSDTLADYDYVIVGGGAAGSLLANRLSSDPSVRVLLVEAGEGGGGWWSRLPIRHFGHVGDPKLDWCLETEPIAGLGGRSLNFPLGRGLGGSTVIGGMIHSRGQAGDFDHWAGLGNAGWGAGDIDRYFCSLKDSVVEIGGGEWQVEGSRMNWPVLDAWLDAAREAGLARANVLDGREAGCGPFWLNQKGGWRMDAAQAFVAPILQRNNLTIVTQAVADKIKFIGGRAQELVLRRNGFPMSIGVRREVVLAAGAVGSAAILMRSGVGPGDVLQQAGVPVVQAREGVGRNLQDHLEVPVVYRVSGAETMNPGMFGMVRQAMMTAGFLIRRTGPLTSAPAPVGAIASADGSGERGDLLIKAQPFVREAGGGALDSAGGITVSVAVLRPESRGRVWIRSGGGPGAVAIQPNYLNAEADRLATIAGLWLVRTIARQAALSRFALTELLPGDSWQSDEELLAAASVGALSGCDVAGTCAMGEGETAVVDARLRVHGVSGLRVADASIMPTLVSGPAGATTLMIAEKGAAMILEDWADVAQVSTSMAVT